MWGQVIGAAGSIISGIMGRNDAAAANKEWWDRTLWQAQKADRVSRRDFQRGRKNMKLADRMSDKNVRLAQRFQARQAEKAWDRTDEAALRNRAWAKADYRQQKQDMDTQFLRLRRAAKKAGFNPLTAMGSQMIPGVAGGLTSSTYGAAPGVGAMPVSALGVSSPMAGDAGSVAVAPLASNEAITGGLYELGMELSGEAAQERANAQVFADLAKIELEQAKARLAAPVVPDFGNLGRQAVAAPSSRSGVPAMSHAGSIPGASPQAALSAAAGFGQDWAPQDVTRFSQSASEVDSNNPRQEELVPMKNEGGMIKVDGDWVRWITGGVPAYIPTINDETVGGEFLGPIMGIGGAALNNRAWQPIREWWRDIPSTSDNERNFMPSLGTSPGGLPLNSTRW